MINTELAAVMAQPKRMVEWANAVKYKAELTSEDKDISKALDAWAKDLGRTGNDPNHELSAMIIKAIDDETVSTPSEIIDMMFDPASIGEFDDYRTQKAPKNTIQVHEAIIGGNVDASYIDFSYLTPTWTTLQAETYLPLQEIRNGGYKTVANLLTFINEALEQKKYRSIFAALDAAITNGSPNYIAEGTSAPTDTSAKELALYLLDMSDGETPLAFGLSKYIQVISGLPGATDYLTKEVKNQWNTDGFVHQFAGMSLRHLSGQKKLADGGLIIPDKRVFGIAGKVGKAITRGETQVFQETDINSEKIHIKVGGYTFGTVFENVDKVAKIVMAL